MFCIVGSFAVNNSFLGIWVMAAMSVVGFLMERNGIPLAPVVLGLVLGPIVEGDFTASVIVPNWDVSQFFPRPVSAASIVLTTDLGVAAAVLRPQEARCTVEEDL